MPSQTISITLPIGLIPDGEKVRKPTGNKTYIVCRKIQIYGDLPNCRLNVEVPDNVMFMTSENSINAVTCDTRVSMDFSSPEDVMEFLESVTTEINEKD